MNQAVRRVFEITECRTQVELAQVLKIRQSSISDAKRRNSIPPDWLLKLLRLKRINPEWILTGEGQRYLVPSDSPEMGLHVIYLTETKPPKQCSAQDLINELVRRALQDRDKSEVAGEVAASWFPVDKE